MKGVDRIKEANSGEAISLNFHSGGIIEVICAKRAGRCGRGLVSTRKATLVESSCEDGKGVASLGSFLSCEISDDEC